ncbi:MAG TPA: formate dehydrogenase subunit gamma [Steroidobacteraceae bacterium]|jgi:formate dehydrogenase subunit gamma|nr:formate dehydrogenase subunit gamma [Steroidobacteraceae bacterium]
METLSPGDSAVVRRIVAEHLGRPGPLLEVLHAVQAALGFIPAGAVPLLAQELNLSRAEVHGVVTFYHYFRRSRPGVHTVSLCQAESCQAMGAGALTEHARKRLGIDFHETTPNGRFSLEPVYCLGNCACSPAAMIDGQLYGRVTAERFDELIAQDSAAS